MLPIRGLAPSVLRQGVGWAAVARTRHADQLARAVARRRLVNDGFGIRLPATRAWESTTTEEKRTGHFSVQPDESLLFFDSTCCVRGLALASITRPRVRHKDPADFLANLPDLFPIKLSAILRLPSEPDRDLSHLLRRFDNSSLGIFDPIRLVKTAIPDDMSLKVTEIMPRLKDGGAFVKVQHDPNISPEEIESRKHHMLQAAFGWEMLTGTTFRYAFAEAY